MKMYDFFINMSLKFVPKGTIIIPLATLKPLV